ncbi:hypothetical protein, partial [Flavobacterium branchiophilum]
MQTKIIKSFIFALSCLSLQQLEAQNYPVNKVVNGVTTNLNIPTNERYVIGVNANPISTTDLNPNVTAFGNSPLSWRADRVVKSEVFWMALRLEIEIQNAINLGYRNIFIQRGRYEINGPIVINADNITIEGESNLTIIKPENTGSDAFPATNSIFEISGKNNVVKNLSIDCSAYTPNNTGIVSAIELKSGAENNAFRDISIDNVGGAGANQTFQKGAIYLNNQTGFINNNLFDNIFMKLINKGIVLNSVASGDGIRHNTFSNIKMDRARENNIVFEGAGFKPFRNTFEDFSIQVFQFQTNIVKDISGDRNVFNRFKNADWKKTSSFNSGAKAINLTSGAWATTITNFEMANLKVHGGSTGASGSTMDDIDDQGKLTQLLYNERAGVMYSQLGFDGFYSDPVNQSGNNKSLTHLKGGLILSAQLGGQNNAHINTAAATKVLTCSDNEGRATWANITGTGGIIWDYKAISNIKMQGHAIINSPTSDLPTSPGIRLDDLGNVRIGTAAPFTTNPAKLQVDGRTIIGTASQEMNDYDAAYKLIVNGKVRVRNEVYVKEAGLTWPDYVFANDYKLMPLQQVAQHIQEKGHLPNMPSATEVEKDGIAVGDIIKRQQEKIEELT